MTSHNAANQPNLNCFLLNTDSSTRPCILDQHMDQTTLIFKYYART
jgi:hypothetical protein